MSKLDTDKLAKLKEMMDRGAFEGERASAKARAEQLAARAGMTLSQALSKLDEGPEQQPPKPPRAQSREENVFQAVFRKMWEERERKDPGCHAREAAEKERKRQEVIARYGSEEAVFAETERERLIREAIERACGPDFDFHWVLEKDAPPEAKQAAKEAYPMPTTVAEAWAEYCYWDSLSDDRWKVDGVGYGNGPGTDLREMHLEAVMGTVEAKTLGDLRARLDWTERYFRREMDGEWEQYGHDKVYGALRADVERLMGRLKEIRDSKPRSSTTAGRAAEVQRILLECPELSDREIARRVGVSPQTVGNWRRKLAQQQMPMAAE